MTSLCQVVRRDFVSGAASRARLAGAGGRRLGCGPGVACPKSWCAGWELAALESESFPGCPPGSFDAAAAAWWASATSRA